MARQDAERVGVTLKAIVARDDQFAFGTEQWDLIVMTFVRTPTNTDAETFWRALKPGGIVVYENGASTTRNVAASRSLKEPIAARSI